MKLLHVRIDYKKNVSYWCFLSYWLIGSLVRSKVGRAMFRSENCIYFKEHDAFPSMICQHVFSKKNGGGGYHDDVNWLILRTALKQSGESWGCQYNLHTPTPWEDIYLSKIKVKSTKHQHARFLLGSKSSWDNKLTDFNSNGQLLFAFRPACLVSLSMHHEKTKSDNNSMVWTRGTVLMLTDPIQHCRCHSGLKAA